QMERPLAPVVAIVQARMGSTRLPGKVLKEIAGHTVLSILLQRLKQSDKLTAVCVATSSLPSDDPIVEECKREGVPYFRGDENDVLGRFYGAALKWTDRT